MLMHWPLGELILLLICIFLFLVFVFMSFVILTSKAYPVLVSYEGEKTFYNPSEGNVLIN